MKQRTLLYLLLICLLGCVGSKGLKTDRVIAAAVDQNFTDAASQYKQMMKILPEEKFPRSYDAKTDKLITSGSEWWCSGFYPGTLLYLYEQTKDEALYSEAMRMLKLLEKEKSNTTTHDLGFIMFCSFGNANRIAPKPEYKEILLASGRTGIGVEAVLEAIVERIPAPKGNPEAPLQDRCAGHRL